MDKKNKIAYVKDAFQSAEQKRILEAISLINSHEMHDAIPFLLDMLRDTDNPAVRDEAALALSDLNAFEAVPVLIEVITNAKNSNHRGTLLYSLQQFDCREYLIDLSKIICDGNFETQEMVIQIFEDIEEMQDKHKLSEAIKVIEECDNESKTKQQRQYISYSKKILKELI